MGRNRNCWRDAIALGMLAMLGLQVSAASADPTSVPFKEDATGVSNMQTGVNTFVETDAGQATQFGSVIVTFDVTFDSATTFHGIATDLTDNGDLVYGSRTGMITSVSPVTVVQYITYIGGTGRFQDVSGSSTMHAMVSPTTGVLHQKITGTISY